MWKKWCEAVDRHNSKLDYATSMEGWSYYTPLIPLMEGFILGLLVTFGLMLNNKELLYSICIGFKYTIMSSSLLGLAFYVNWKINE